MIVQEWIHLRNRIVNLEHDTIGKEIEFHVLNRIKHEIKRNVWDVVRNNVSRHLYNYFNFGRHSND
jgi:hypothetical protein